MTTEIIVAALASGGLGAILVAIVNGIFSKRKLGAEATEIITRAAAGVVESLEGQLKAQRDLMRMQTEAYEKERAEWAMERAESIAAWKRHIAWDEAVIARVEAEAGIKLPPAPTPPRFHE